MKYIHIFAFLCFTINITAQNKLGKSDDAQRIILSSFIPKYSEGLPRSARKLLSNKLSRITTKYGLGGSSTASRFIITPKIDVLTKDITPTAPVMTAITLGVTINIGDGIDGIKYASGYIEAKGVGTNETKAYMSAIKRININSPDFKDMIESGKNKIIEYYNTKCDFILTEAKTLKDQKKYDLAIYKLTSIPQVCKECYDKGNNLVAAIYKEKINNDCRLLLSKAQNTWNASQNTEGAKRTGSILSKIDPDANCFSDVKSLHKSIAAKIKALDKREWQYKLKEQQQESERIKAVRDIGVAIAKNQPKTVYKTEVIRGW